MEKWIGATGICINPKGQVLMVLQGRPDEQKLWATPSGGLEQNESIEECCKREVLEETGYEVEVIKQLFIKEGISYGFQVEVHYFEVRIIGGNVKIQDPDQLIYDIAWKSSDEILEIELSFPEDRNLLIDLIHKKVNKK
ncbi:NUDIX hydrolase [Bacillus sp. AFS088145]|uniref:NUDIX hydrolase n=1 Tax=Bacillus sp. AFS088145 TaxID=2033514 RepID=UPI000BF7763E|nr:NUDIX hydrolase [Bacillus sp. AFS088145]PFH87967.1 DNA mismatch repair protein MutT [Bacillus sp. AFS088145]